MRKPSTHFQFLQNDVYELSVPLQRTYNYISLSPNEDFMSYTNFWADISKQDEVVIDWNEPDLQTLQHWYLDSIDGDSDIALNTLFWDRHPTLVSFFASQMVDIPAAFRKSKSLYTPSMSTPQLRLISMLMRHGRKAYTSKLYSVVASTILSKITTRISETTEPVEWRLYYNLFTHFKFFGNQDTSPKTLAVTNLPRLEFADKFKQSYTSVSCEADSDRWAQTLIYDELMKYLPLFSFYVQKVDKLKRKHSRGKSGKYTITWKYVPRYKRFITVLRWLVQDVRFQKSKTFFLRILKSLESLFFDKSNHLVYRFRHFVNQFVFQHHKKTLLKTLKSVS